MGKDDPKVIGEILQQLGYTDTEKLVAALKESNGEYETIKHIYKNHGFVKLIELEKERQYKVIQTFDAGIHNRERKKSISINTVRNVPGTYIEIEERGFPSRLNLISAPFNIQQTIDVLQRKLMINMEKTLPYPALVFKHRNKYLLKNIGHQSPFIDSHLDLAETYSNTLQATSIHDNEKRNTENIHHTEVTSEGIVSTINGKPHFRNYHREKIRLSKDSGNKQDIQTVEKYIISQDERQELSIKQQQAYLDKHSKHNFMNTKKAKKLLDQFKLSLFTENGIKIENDKK